MNSMMPFWMSKNRSLCIAFLTISDQYHNFYVCEIFLQNGCHPSENHFWSHFWPFQIDTQFIYFWEIQIFYFYKMSAGGHFGWPKITFHLISGHFRSIRNFFFWNFWQNGWCRPIWMSKIHFQSHFWPFQIDTQLWLFLTKWLTSAILDVWNSLSIAFLAISDWYATLFFLEIFDKMAAVGHFGLSEIHFGSHFLPF